MDDLAPERRAEDRPGGAGRPGGDHVLQLRAGLAPVGRHGRRLRDEGQHLQDRRGAHEPVHLLARPRGRGQLLRAQPHPDRADLCPQHVDARAGRPRHGPVRALRRPDERRERGRPAGRGDGLPVLRACHGPRGSGLARGFRPACPRARLGHRRRRGMPRRRGAPRRRLAARGQEMAGGGHAEAKDSGWGSLPVRAWARACYWG